MATQTLSDNLSKNTPDQPGGGGWFSWWWNWITPRSENRDEAFRERTIRVTVAVLLLLTGTALLSNVLIFQQEGQSELISYPNLTIVTFLLFLASAITVARRQVALAGVLLVIGLLIAAFGITVMDTYGAYVLPTYMLSVLVAALVLPRSQLLPLWGASLVIYVIIAVLQQDSAPPPADPNAPDPLVGGIVNMLLFLGTEVFFLSRLRVEFDERLSAVQLSYRQAEEARAEADRANTAKSRFLASMSHEFRTPLNAIIGYIDIMLTGMAGDAKEQRDRMHTHIKENATRLLSSINDTLDMARIESGRVRIDVEQLSPRQLIDSMVGSMNSLAQKKGIYLEAEFSENVPDTVIGDKTKLQQILTNLLGNALKFTHEGGVTVKVSGADNDQWRFAVTDTGIGMPEDAGTYVFDSFRQVEDGNHRNYEGTGLGLAITRRWVTLMGGTIELKTAPGKGSSFIVTLPQTVEEGEAEESPSQERREAAKVAG